MPVLPFVVAGGLLTALLFAFGGEDDTPPIPPPPPPTPPRDPVGPMPLPDTSPAGLDAFDGLMCECWEALGPTTTAEQLRACIAGVGYPAVPFPPIEGDHSSVLATWEWMLARCVSFISAPNKGAWCMAPPPPPPIDPKPGPKPFEPVEPPPDEGLSPFEMLVGLTAPVPTPGRFYLIGSDPDQGQETFSAIVRKALNKANAGAGEDAQRRIAYMKLVTSGPRWNWSLYASTAGPTNAWPSYTFVNGRSLRRAWDAWHADVKLAVANGKMPKRAMNLGGVKVSGVGTKYGMLWLPPLNPDFLAEDVVTLQGLEWDDGSSVIDPPPELLDTLGPA